MKIVVDTNVLIAAARSSEGVSFRFMDMVLQGRFEVQISTPLLLEYEEILERTTVLQSDQIALLLSRIYDISVCHDIYYLFRGILPDDDDVMVLEVAIKSNAQYIVTYNIRDFKATTAYGISAITPKDILHLIGVLQ